MNQTPTTLLVTQDAIRAYAELSNDFNPIHLDPEFAAKTPMNGIIAHGTMSLCLLWKALARTFGPDAFERLDLNVGFVKPVRIGETLSAGCQARADDPATYDVWVRSGDGTDRISGSVRVADATDAPASSTNTCEKRHERHIANQTKQ